MNIQKDTLSIKDCVKEYGIAITTLRRWIKKGELPASFSDNQYTIQREDLEKLLINKGILKPKTSMDTQRVSIESIQDTQLSTQVSTQLNTMDIQLDILKKENEFLKEKIKILEQDKQFLQAQVQQLTNTISLLTTRQLPEPKGIIDRIKGWFKKE